jgi:hypothetical protein
MLCKPDWIGGPLLIQAWPGRAFAHIVLLGLATALLHGMKMQPSLFVSCSRACSDIKTPTRYRGALLREAFAGTNSPSSICCAVVCASLAIYPVLLLEACVVCRGWRTMNSGVTRHVKPYPPPLSSNQKLDANSLPTLLFPLLRVLMSLSHHASNILYIYPPPPPPHLVTNQRPKHFHTTDFS